MSGASANTGAIARTRNQEKKKRGAQSAAQDRPARCALTKLFSVHEVFRVIGNTGTPGYLVSRSREHAPAYRAATVDTLLDLGRVADVA